MDDKVQNFLDTIVPRKGKEGEITFNIKNYDPDSRYDYKSNNSRYYDSEYRQSKRPRYNGSKYSNTEERLTNLENQVYELQQKIREQEARNSAMSQLIYKNKKEQEKKEEEDKKYRECADIIGIDLDYFKWKFNTNTTYKVVVCIDFPNCKRGKSCDFGHSSDEINTINNLRFFKK